MNKAFYAVHLEHFESSTFWVLNILSHFSFFFSFLFCFLICNLSITRHLLNFIHRVDRHINYKFIYFCYRDTQYKKKVFETKERLKTIMSKSNNHISKQIMKDSIDQENIVDIKVFFVESKINLIMKKHFKKRTSNIESIRKFLNIMLNEKNLNTLIKKLKKFKRNVVYEIVYCMKKQFINSRVAV